MNLVRLVLNWLIVLLIPIWSLPLVLVAIGGGIRGNVKEPREIFLLGKIWVWNF